MAVLELTSDLFRFGSRYQGRNNPKCQVRTGGPYWI